MRLTPQFCYDNLSSLSSVLLFIEMSGYGSLSHYHFVAGWTKTLSTQPAALVKQKYPKQPVAVFLCGKIPGKRSFFAAPHPTTYGTCTSDFPKN